MNRIFFCKKDCVPFFYVQCAYFFKKTAKIKALHLNKTDENAIIIIGRA